MENNAPIKKKPVVNYLSIQLRDMDYANFFPKSTQYRFLDRDIVPKYDNGGAWRTGFNNALNTVTRDTLHRTKDVSGKWRQESLEVIFRGHYQERLAREKDFIKAWVSYHNKLYPNNTIDEKKIKTMFPNVNRQMPSERQVLKYALAFSELITQMISMGISEEDDIIIKTLRDSNFATMIAGKTSSLSSAATIKKLEKENKTKSLRENQSLANSYYEELFNIFCIGNKTGIGSADKIKAQFNTDGALEALKTNASYRTIFRQKFKAFVDKYYEEISPQIDATILRQIQNKSFDAIFQEVSGSIIKISATQMGEGMAEQSQKKLKKMFLETLRQVSLKSKGRISYSDLSIKGAINLNENWETTETLFNKSLQMQISDKNEGLMKQFKKTSGDRRENENMREKIEIFSNQYFKWLMDKIKEYNSNTSFSNEAQNKLRKATISTVGKRTWGSKMLENLSAFGPGQVRGLLGEIATAYSLNIGAKTKTQITGAQLSGSKTGQVHYDIKARINLNKKITEIGFQVKNYKVGDKKSAKLYSTSLGLGNSDMKRYFKDQDIINYLWLFANGKFLTEAGYFQNLKNQMEISFHNALPYFLRIGDAANGTLKEQFNSDIYVIGDRYYPASYLIAKAYHSAFKNGRKMEDINKLFTLKGEFPSYSKKYISKKHGSEYYWQNVGLDSEGNIIYDKTDRLRFRMKYINSEGKTSYEKANLVYIEKHLRRLANAQIDFSGITVEFTI